MRISHLIIIIAFVYSIYGGHSIQCYVCSCDLYIFCGSTCCFFFWFFFYNINFFLLCIWRSFVLVRLLPLQLFAILQLQAIIRDTQSGRMHKHVEKIDAERSKKKNNAYI